MKKISIFILFISFPLLIIANSFAQQQNNDLKSNQKIALKASHKKSTKSFIGFLSSSDYLNDTASGITLHNVGSQVTVTGLYLQALKETDCTSLTSEANLGYGGTWVKGTVLNGGSVTIGGNFLYNMILNFRFQTDNSIGPGTPGNPANSSTPSSTVWCIKLGLVNGSASAASVTVSGNLISYAQATSILVTCNDTTEVCEASSSVTQDFPQ